MGVMTEFMGKFTTSRPLTQEELKEYKDVLNKDEDMFLLFTSSNELEGIESAKVAGYIDMEQGFMKTLNWLKSKDITFTGRINYSSDYILSEDLGLGFGAFVATPENVTYHKLDFTGLKIVSNVIYTNFA
jgi:hypothetical protein